MRWRPFDPATELPADTHPRLFVAVPLAEGARGAVETLVGEVRAAVEAGAREPRSEVRWVRLDGLHLTIRFLGPTEVARIPDLAAVVDEAAAASRPFRVSLSGAGAFPSPARPRTLWLGVGDGQSELAALSDRLNRGLQTAGWARDDRPFTAHLTLGRSDGRREGPLAARELAARAAGLDASFDADRLVLFESLTGGGPARYVIRHEARLGG
ncbi:MAG: RNA 2',3'-cyclic phosphodiesterase [Chloroflexota bacterium]|nr:RNA 2',3'-cyclic phosphodiesterase [Chloroflexota bacterium]